MQFNRDKHKLLYLGRNNGLHKYSAEKDQLDHSSAEKDWGEDKRGSQAEHDCVLLRKRQMLYLDV